MVILISQFKYTLFKHTLFKNVEKVNFFNQKCTPALLTLAYANIRLTASYRFCALLLCLHNSCPVDTLEFWQIFHRSILKQRPLGVCGAESSTSLFLKDWDFLIHLSSP